MKPAQPTVPEKKNNILFPLSILLVIVLTIGILGLSIMTGYLFYKNQVLKKNLDSEIEDKEECEETLTELEKEDEPIAEETDLPLGEIKNSTTSFEVATKLQEIYKEELKRNQNIEISDIDTDDLRWTVEGDYVIYVNSSVFNIFIPSDKFPFEDESTNEILKFFNKTMKDYDAEIMELNTIPCEESSNDCSSAYILYKGETEDKILNCKIDTPNDFYYTKDKVKGINIDVFCTEYLQNAYELEIDYLKMLESLGIDMKNIGIYELGNGDDYKWFNLHGNRSGFQVIVKIEEDYSWTKIWEGQGHYPCSLKEEYPGVEGVVYYDECEED